MTTTVERLIEIADCGYGGNVQWGTPVPEPAGGIYLIALAPDPHWSLGVVPPPIDPTSVERLLDFRPELTLDGKRPSLVGLLDRLAAMWIPDEPVVYIGKATSLAARVSQYYSTPLGARSPHAGGWPLKVLSNIDELTVHWAVSPMPELAEQKALAAFVNGVSPSSRQQLVDPDHPYPYANLEGPGGRKRHGVLGAREPRERRSPKHDSPRPSNGVTRSNRSTPSTGRRGRTQWVTASDLKAGRVRIPRAYKGLFPPERTNVDLILRSKPLNVCWDPRMGPPERSGNLGIGRNLLFTLVEENEVLEVSYAKGRISLD